jgi:tripartite-type tricarboxylate transporter receptor subunit TctC
MEATLQAEKEKIMVTGMQHGLLLLALLFAAGTHAQNYPIKPVRIVAATTAGGSVDMVARMVGQRLSEAFGQQFLIENRPGASNNIGTDYVAKSAPDGYTLLMASSPALASNIHLYPKLPFDPVKDFVPIILIVNQPNVLVLNPRVPVASVKEFVALVRSRPGKLTFASSGMATSQHIAAELFMLMTGVNMVHIPYKGGAPALIDTVGGQVDLMFETAPTAIPFVKSGKLKALGVTTLKRSGMLPDVPTLNEAGVKGYEFRGWIGLVAPAATPKDVTAKLHAEVQNAINGDLRKRLIELGLDVAGGTAEQFAAFIREDSARYEKIIKKAGISL